LPNLSAALARGWQAIQHGGSADLLVGVSLMAHLADKNVGAPSMVHGEFQRFPSHALGP